MSFCTTGARIANRAARQVEIPVAVLPAFLCPGILRHNLIDHSTRWTRQHTTEAAQKKPEIRASNWEVLRPLASDLVPTFGAKLPIQCPGCGALSQAVQPDEPGFYTLTRKSLREYYLGKHGTKLSKEKEIFGNSLSALEGSKEAMVEQKSILGELSSTFADTKKQSTYTGSLEPPVCDRCHNLKHHETGVSIHHPSVQSLQDTIFESPHKYNHIYHIIDAADFPMSLVQGLHKLLHLTPQRSHNRRSQTGKFFHGRKTEVSFIITRSDLLGPTKEHVDKLMPYLRSVLRDALGRAAQDARLGNLRCVSAKRQWWTKELKEEIWNRGGGGWMVGKVNVGKSQLFQEVFPKGRMGDRGKHTTISTKMRTEKDIPTRPITEDEIAGLVGEISPAKMKNAAKASETELETPKFEDLGQGSASENDLEASLNQEADHISESQALESPEAQSNTFEPFNTTSLLPPLPTEIDYPAMPLVSSLPGTTASPIRVPFGNGKGELIDLPGLSRSDFELYVEPEHRSSLLMRSPSNDSHQRVLKPGQSLLVGGLIRITTTTPDLHILYHNFTPLPMHQTSTEKAVGIQSGTRETNVENIAIGSTDNKIRSAGTFHLKWDVTKARTGPVTRSDAAGIKVERLPFRVLGLDILIEGVGWVELAAQIRKPYGYLERGDKREFEPEEHEADPSWPEIEVFSPEGRFVGQRRPMNASIMNGDKSGSKSLKGRPRKAMKGVKKIEKKRAREAKFPAPE